MQTFATFTESIGHLSVAATPETEMRQRQRDELFAEASAVGSRRSVRDEF